MEQTESITSRGRNPLVEGVSFVEQLGAYTMDWGLDSQQLCSSSHSINENRSPLSAKKPLVNITAPGAKILENSDLNQIALSPNDRRHNHNNQNNSSKIQSYTHQPMVADDNDTEVSPLESGTFKMNPIPTTNVVDDADVPFVPPQEIVVRLKAPVKAEIPRPASPVVRRFSAPEVAHEVKPEVPKWLRISVDGPSTPLVYPRFRPEDEWVPVVDPQDAWLQEEDFIPAPPVTPSRRPRFLASPFGRRKSRRSSAPEQRQQLSVETSKGDQEETMDSGLEFQPQGAGICEMGDVPRPMPAPRNSSAPTAVQPLRQRQNRPRRGARFFFKQESCPELSFSPSNISSSNNIKNHNSNRVAPDGYYKLDQHHHQCTSPKSSPTPTFSIPHGTSKKALGKGDGVFCSGKGLAFTYDLQVRSTSTNSAGQTSFHTEPTDGSECESFSSHCDNNHSHGLFHPRLNVVPETPEQQPMTDTILLSPSTTKTSATPKSPSRRSLWGIVSSPLTMKKKSTILASSKKTGLISTLDLRRSSRGCLA